MIDLFIWFLSQITGERVVAFLMGSLVSWLLIRCYYRGLYQRWESARMAQERAEKESRDFERHTKKYCEKLKKVESELADFKKYPIRRQLRE